MCLRSSFTTTTKKIIRGTNLGKTVKFNFQLKNKIQSYAVLNLRGHFIYHFSFCFKQRSSRKVFFNQMLYECLLEIQFRLIMNKNVYMQGMRLVFVLLEKLVEPFFELDLSSIGGNEKVKTQLTKTHRHHYMLNLWEN